MTIVDSPRTYEHTRYNETGLGVVPMGEISRRFVDEAGRLHQALGQSANKVMFCVAGFPMILKDEK